MSYFSIFIVIFVHLELIFFILYLFKKFYPRIKRETNITSMLLINSKYHQNNGVKQLKTTTKVYFPPTAKDPDSNDRVKMQQKLLSLILLTFVIYLSGFDLLNMSCFS